MKIKYGLCVCANVGLLLLMAACSATAPPTTVSPTTAVQAPTPVPITPGVPPPAGATGPPRIGVSTLPPVPTGKPARFTDAQAVAEVVRIDPVDITAQGPGQESGTGLAVGVQFTNESPAAIDLADVVVNASYANGTPASPSESAPAKPLTGRLEVGGSQTGVYVFNVPAADAESLVVEINFSRSANVVLVRR